MVRLASVSRKIILIFILFFLSSFYLLSRPTCDDVILASLEYHNPITSDESDGHHGNTDRLVTGVDCRALIEEVDGGRELERARRYMVAHPYKSTSDSELRRHLTSGCDVVRRLVTAQYESERQRGREEERDYPLAFTILVHKDGAQVLRLLRQIYRPHNYYCIHVDAKSSSNLSRSISAVAECLPNVYLPGVRENVVYGHYTRLKAELQCMKRLLEASLDNSSSLINSISNIKNSSISNIDISNSRNSERTDSSTVFSIDSNTNNSSSGTNSNSIPTNSKRWKYLINLTGQMFPLKTNLEMVRILQIFNGSNDIEGLSRWHLDGMRARVDFKWMIVRGSLKKTKERNPRPPHNINLVKGSAYGAFSYDLIDFIFRDKTVQEFLSWSENVYSPDEIFWGTVNSRWVNPMFQTPGGHDAAPERKPWFASHSSWRGAGQCAGKFVRDSCVFGAGDLPRLVSRKELFANKFHEGYEYLAVDCLEEWLRNKSRSDLPIDLQYYRNVKNMLNYRN